MVARTPMYVTLTFNDSPTLSNLLRDCDAANENYTVQLTISGGTLPYSVNNTVIADSVFLSAPIVTGATEHSFSVMDANGCDIPDITGTFICNCTTNAGTMSATTLQTRYMALPLRQSSITTLCWMAMMSLPIFCTVLPTSHWEQSLRKTPPVFLVFNPV